MRNNDLISRAALLKHKCNCYDEDGHLLYAVPTGYIVNAPSVDVVYDECSSLFGQYVYKGDARKYYPDGGAKMDGGTDDD